MDGIYKTKEVESMSNKKVFCRFNNCQMHKGFYNEGEPNNALSKIYYEHYFEYPEDEEFPYDTARTLLCGSCHLFALALKEILGYTPYVIEGNNKKGFHAFCQVYKDRRWYYIDARGITSSFDEFLYGIRTFVSDEYTIRILEDKDIEKWKTENNEYNDDYEEKGFLFARAVIDNYKECYILND